MEAKQKFPLGQVEVTEKARECIESDEIASALVRHGAGDWGVWLEVEDNELCLQRGRALSSRYVSRAGKVFQVFTNGKRSLTKVSLTDDEEYPESEGDAWMDEL